MSSDSVAELTEIEHKLAAAFVAGDSSFHEDVLADDWSVIDPAGRIITKAQVLSESFTAERDLTALHDALARAWRDWGLPERGLTSAHRAVYYAPESAEARNTLGTVLWALGQRQPARRAFEDAVALDPHAWYAVRNLCEVALTDGRTKDATTLCRRATALRKAAGEATR